MNEAYLQRRQPSQGKTVPVAFRTPFVLRDSCGCPSQTPKAGPCKHYETTRVCLPPAQSAPGPPFFCQKPKQVHRFLSFSLQANMGWFQQGAGTLNCPLSWSFMTEVCGASSLSSFMMFLPSSIPASRRKSSI